MRGMHHLFWAHLAPCDCRSAGVFLEIGSVISPITRRSVACPTREGILKRASFLRPVVTTSLLNMAATAARSVDRIPLWGFKGQCKNGGHCPARFPIFFNEVTNTVIPIRERETIQHGSHRSCKPGADKPRSFDDRIHTTPGMYQRGWGC